MTDYNIVDYWRFSDRHRYVTEESVENIGGPIPPCKVCGQLPTNHWFPNVEKENADRIQRQVDEIVDEYNRRLLE